MPEPILKESIAQKVEKRCERLHNDLGILNHRFALMLSVSYCDWTRRSIRLKTQVF